MVAVLAPRWRRLPRAAASWLRRDVAGFLGRLTPLSPPAAGLYFYPVSGAGFRRKLHLRVEDGGGATLFVDATYVLHLDPGAALLAKAALDGRAREAVRPAWVAGRAGGARRAAADCDAVFDLVEALRRPGEGCPLAGLALAEAGEPFSRPPAAPWRADLLLTVACENRCGHCYNEPAQRALPELDAAGWRAVLARLAALGVPHVIFTGGEPTGRPDLPELVAEASRLGLATGLNTNGRRLAGDGLAADLAAAGLDHVQVTLHAAEPEVHDRAAGVPGAWAETLRGLERARAAGLHLLTNTTLTRLNAPGAPELPAFLAERGVKTFAMNAMIHAGRGRNHPQALGYAELAAALAAIRDRAQALGQRFLWYTPTCWCRLSPLALGLGPRRCSAAEYAVAVAPDGGVLPCQSAAQSAGNLLADPWPEIWDSELFRRLRGRREDPGALGLPAACGACPDFRLCGGGCPLEREALGELRAAGGPPGGKGEKAGAERGE